MHITRLLNTILDLVKTLIFQLNFPSTIYRVKAILQ